MHTLSLVTATQGFGGAEAVAVCGVSVSSPRLWAVSLGGSAITRKMRRFISGFFYFL